MRLLRGSIGLVFTMWFSTLAVADADAAKRAAAERLAATIVYENLAQDLGRAVTKMVPPEYQSMLVEEVDVLVASGQLRALYVDIFETVLSLEELDALIAFYETPVGRQIRAKESQMAILAVQRQQCLMLPILERVVVQQMSQALPNEDVAAIRRKAKAAMARAVPDCANL